MRNENPAPTLSAPSLHTTKRHDGSSDETTGDSPIGPERKSALNGVPLLVVEDDIPSARLTGYLLHEAGADVRVVHSAEAALVTLQTFQPRVLVVDLILPRMSGLLLVQQLKADPSTADIVVVAVTSMNGPESERMVLAAGCAAYIRKPIDVDTFAATVARAMEKTS